MIRPLEPFPIDPLIASLPKADLHLHLLDRLAASGATVEFCLTSNVVFGAVPSYGAHPIPRFVDRGIPVTLSTDLPLHVCTTIGREYAFAAALGFGPAELLQFTRNAIQASFTSAARRAALLDRLARWEAGFHHCRDLPE